MNEKEIIEIIAGLNPAALEAFNSFMYYKYTELFANLFAGISIALIIAGFFYKMAQAARKW